MLRGITLNNGIQPFLGKKVDQKTAKQVSPYVNLKFLTNNQIVMR